MSTVEILPVSPQHVAKVWPLVDKYVEDSLKFAQGCFLPVDIRDFCTQGKMQLWIATRGDSVLAAVVSEITDYPRKRICAVPFIGGKDLRSWFRKMLITIETWSKEMGCVGMQGGARRGWGKLANMDEVGVVLFRSYDLGAPFEAPMTASQGLH
jgi:hypothetical protein